MIKITTDLPTKFKYRYVTKLSFGRWDHSYELIGAHGGLILRVSGPHQYNGADNWSAGLELHSRTPLYGDTAPDHDMCWLLNCPCWHDGTSSWAQEYFLPMVLNGDHDRIFRAMATRADEQWPGSWDANPWVAAITFEREECKR